jgi:hypothetical protein
MPFALLLIGIVLLVAGIRNTQCILFAEVEGDFTGTDNFFYWFLAIMIIGALGYVPKLKPISTALLVLVVVVLFLYKGQNGGFFQQLTAGFSSDTSTSTAATTLAQQQATTQGLLNQLSPYIGTTGPGASSVVVPTVPLTYQGSQSGGLTP